MWSISFRWRTQRERQKRNSFHEHWAFFVCGAGYCWHAVSVSRRHTLTHKYRISYDRKRANSYVNESQVVYVCESLCVWRSWILKRRWKTITTTMTTKPTSKQIIKWLSETFEVVVCTIVGMCVCVCLCEPYGYWFYYEVVSHNPCNVWVFVCVCAWCYACNVLIINN